LTIGTASDDGDRRPLRRALIALCLTEIISWGVLYYAFPVALASISADTGWSETAATAAFSTGLVVSAVVGIPVGRLLDRRGPRWVMTGGSVLAVPALVLIALAPTLPVFFAGWVIAGVAMACVFYQAGFAALTRWYGPQRVRALTTLTLVAGLASTVFAPATSVLLQHLDWRSAYLVLAGVLAVITIPTHALFLTPRWTPTRHPTGPGHPRQTPADVRNILRSNGFLVLCGCLTVTAFGLYAASLTLIPLLTSRGLTPSLAAVALGLLGAGQLFGRIGYAPLSARTTPGTRTVLILGAASVSVATLAVVPGPAAALIALAILVGATRGATTLLQATIVADNWGTTHYATLAGFFAAPITIATAIAPWAGTALATGIGSYPVTFAVLAALIAAATVLALLTRNNNQPHSPVSQRPAAGAQRDPNPSID